MVLQFVPDIDVLSHCVFERLKPSGVFIFAVHNPAYVDVCVGAGVLFYPTEEGETFEINLADQRFPLYRRTREDYRTILELAGLGYCGESLPAFPIWFVERYQPELPASEPEFLIMAFRERRQ